MNEYQIRNDAENMREMHKTVALLNAKLTDLTEKMDEVYKEVRSVREDLRNLDNIRALRK